MKVFFEVKKESLGVGENESCVWRLKKKMAWERAGICDIFESYGKLRQLWWLEKFNWNLSLANLSSNFQNILPARNSQVF